MNARIEDPILPRGALLGAGILVLTTLVLVAAARLAGYRPDRPAPSAVVSRIDLRFADRANGAIAIYSADGGRLLDTLAPGTNGFVRGVLRGLALVRDEEHIGVSPPFRLTRWADGRLSLDDPSTGRHVDLEAFGPTNSGAFAGILNATLSSEGVHR
ncbi:MAG: phosphonate-binding protein [Gammaproteobacteria bacterium]|nr:phosphonate-binding protein [Gammaproteobacteria bacterium]MDE2348076.1 phosphonate-binding protein [Gammaproteobacteria bacterium]